MEQLRSKSSALKKKVRKANDEEKAERLKTAALEREIAALEDQLAHKIHELDPAEGASDGDEGGAEL